jgi:hypothetical protein
MGHAREFVGAGLLAMASVCQIHFRRVPINRGKARSCTARIFKKQISDLFFIIFNPKSLLL